MKTWLTLTLCCILHLTMSLVIQPSAASSPISSRAEPSPVVCLDWPATLGESNLNVAGPDTQANYWILHYSTVPGARLVIRGQYPQARFFSFAVQDESATTLGSLRDDKINPDRASRNPFRSRRPVSGINSYTAYLDFGPTPQRGAPNTFYAGQTLEGLPNPGGTVIYRVYVPSDQSDPQGGVPLPTVALELPGGEQVSLTLGRCSTLPGNIGGPGNAQFSTSDFPEQIPPTKPRNPAYLDPTFERIFSGQFTDPATNALPASIADQLPRRPGVPLQNADFPYLMSHLSRYVGKVAVVRYRAPSFPDTLQGESVVGSHQVRYWSLCSYSPPIPESEMRVYGCAADFATAADKSGWLWFVISDPAHRPDAAIDPTNGVHWLPWGASNDGMLIARFGIPRDSWRYSPLHVSPSDDPATGAQKVMKDFYPDARYCTKTRIVRKGIAACFS